MLVAGIAVRADFLQPAEGFLWLGSWPALIAFALATVIEIGAFYIPWLDNLLDTIATPAAAVAGTLLFGAVAIEMDPMLQWTLAVIAGGGSATLVQGGTVVARAASTSTTGGAANFTVATAETTGSLFFSVLAIVLPILAVALLLAALIFLYYIGRRMFFRRRVKTT